MVVGFQVLVSRRLEVFHSIKSLEQSTRAFISLPTQCSNCTKPPHLRVLKPKHDPRVMVH
jgi:hypothetical protein